MKNRLVKISLLLIALLILFCFVACGDDTPESTPDSTQQSTPTPESTPAEETVIVEFDPGRGDFVDEDFEGEIEIKMGDTIDEYPEAERKGYMFSGWFFDEDMEDECDEDYEFDEDTILYAGWISESQLTKYTVKFDTSRATDGVTIENQLVIDGKKATKPEHDPVRGGSTFYGWCVDGDKSKVWDFDNDIVTADVTLVAVFEAAGGTGGGTTTCVHNYVKVEEESKAPTCEADGILVEKCTKCRHTKRTKAIDDPSLKKLGHDYGVERVEPTCALDGYETQYCKNGCGISKTKVLKATGAHEYSDDPNNGGWFAAIKPTTYVSGRMERNCIICGGATETMFMEYGATSTDLKKADISFMYTGGAYVNAPFVNVATLGSAYATSQFIGTKAYDMIDANDNTFWNADTYVDGARYTDDYAELTLPRKFDIGAIRFVLPNYVAWDLGEGCYVSYDLEYWDYEKEEWVFLGEVSDKDAVSIGIKCELMVELDTPINTDKVRARVTHATRYAPAVIYEFEVFAKSNEVQREPLAIPSRATASVSGKYNEWVNGAGALTDNTTGTYWSTDRRYNATPWALYEFPTETYIACLQFSCRANENRRFKLEIYENGQWVEVGKYTVPGVDPDTRRGIIGGDVISNSSTIKTRINEKTGSPEDYVDIGICMFSVDLEKEVSKIKLSLIQDPVYWESYVYDITPYTVVEKASGETDPAGCTHKNPVVGTVVAPTCDKTGYTEYNCFCGVMVKSESKDALGHKWGRYEVTEAATATALGTKTSTCTREGCTATSTMSYEDKYDAPVITPYLHNAPAAWAMTFDDGNYMSTYEWVIPQLEKYGFRATTVMSIVYTDALVSKWQDYFDRGVFDLGSHSYNHTSAYAGGVSASSLLNEVINAQYWFRHNYSGQKILGFAAPLGATSMDVAEYLTGPLAANRNGGDTNIIYNLIENLTKRTVWGDLNSYISKADQHEGVYVFLNVNEPNGTYIKGEDDTYTWSATGSYDKNGNFIADDSGEYVLLRDVYGTYQLAKKGAHYVYSEADKKFVDKGVSYGGTYYYNASEWKYEYKLSGSYNLSGDKFEFVSDDSGRYKLVKAALGTYELGVEELYERGAWTVECLHSIEESRDFISGIIHSSYVSNVSRFEHLTRLGFWVGSYNDLIQYFKETQNAKLEIVERTDATITISVTDTLDNYMFDHPVTVKVDIPDSWESVSVTQNGKEIPLVDYASYTMSRNMTTISCAIDDGYLYVDVIPDGGNVVITLGEKNDGIADYQDRVTVTYNPGIGSLDWDEYDVKVVVGQTYKNHPTPVKEGYYFRGWYLDEDCAMKVTSDKVYTENVTLYALWEEMPVCTNGTYTHNWAGWQVVGDHEERKCKNCGSIDRREIEVVVKDEETAE